MLNPPLFLSKYTSSVNVTTFPFTVAFPNTFLNASAEFTSTAPPLTEPSNPAIKTSQLIKKLFLLIFLYSIFLFRHAGKTVSNLIPTRNLPETDETDDEPEPPKDETKAGGSEDKAEAEETQPENGVEAERQSEANDAQQSADAE